ncbi:MAG: T9SS type A sorting domain-containing protein [Bacteroidales bacterium]|jgi:thiol-disulfide isomerase/thioredoxin|nr:T9SS type A sorting domain-containing protein [Bacteroidales bacterium]
MKARFLHSMILLVGIAFISQIKAQEALPRLVLVEEFTSSTCPPCASLNQYFNPWLESVADKTAVVKYQMNYPGAGDPYYTSECGARQSYYGNIQGVPTPFVAGIKQDSDDIQTYPQWIALINSSFLAAYAEEPKSEIAGEFIVSGTNIQVTAIVTPTEDLTDCSIFIAVCERLTTKNKRTNGETEFHHVMMKMLPNANGTPITTGSGVPVSLSFSHDMSTTHVEEMDDLEVVVFIQKISKGKQVYDAVYLNDITSAAPNDVTATHESGTLNVNVTWEAPAGATPTGYNVYRNGERLNDTPATTLSYSDVAPEYGITYKYGVAAIVNGRESYYGYDEVITMVDVPVAINVTARQIMLDEKDMIVTWEMPDTKFPISGYNVYRNNIRINSTLITDLFFENAGISFREYCFEVEAILNELTGEKSEKGCVTLKQDGIPAPQNLQVKQTAIDELKVDLTWDAVTEITVEGYNIYRNKIKINDAPITSTAYQDEIPEFNIEYCYTVRALVDNLAGLKSGEACIKAIHTESIAQNNLEAAINIYPNPVTDKLYLNTELNISTYQIYDLYGRMIHSSKTNIKELSTSGWASGVYFIRIETEKGTVNKRFIKQ